MNNNTKHKLTEEQIEALLYYKQKGQCSARCMRLKTGFCPLKPLCVDLPDKTGKHIVPVNEYVNILFREYLL